MQKGKNGMRGPPRADACEGQRLFRGCQDSWLRLLCSPAGAEWRAMAILSWLLGRSELPAYPCMLLSEPHDLTQAANEAIPSQLQVQVRSCHTLVNGSSGCIWCSPT